MGIDDNEYVRLFGTLNENQKKALTTTNNCVLEIVAGPGTGKTKLLISRVAYLILNFNIPTSGIIVTTFTKKAANEMITRLNSLLINYNINLQNLQIGTFHSICFGYLKYYGKFIDLKKFSIADNKDQKGLLLEAINNLCLDDIKSDKSSIKQVQNYISEQKSLGFHPDDVIINDTSDKIEIQYFQIYSKYHELLKRNSMIDFDDILVYTYKLLSIKPECISHVKHILIDEFQDTNSIQLKLILKFSQYCNDNITIVGDADQSIYGFRNATYKNFKLLEKLSLENNRNFVKITLDQNYRSTNSILKIAESLMRNQKERDNKQLISNNSNNDPVYLIHHNSSSDEPIFIANKIAGMIENNYKPKDFAIIVRVSRTFLSLERELSRKGIPYKIVKGQSFWDLKEISMTIDCLRIISNDDWLAYKRILDWFAPGCGLKLIEKLENDIFNSNVSDIPYGTVYRTLIQFSTGVKTGMSSKAKASIIHLLSSIDECRNKLNTNDIHNFFKFVLDKFNIVENSLKKKSSNKKNDDELKYDIIENLSELKNQFENYNPEEDELLRKAQEQIFVQQEEKLSKDIIKDKISSETITKKETTSGEENSHSKVKFLSTFLDHIHLAESISTDDPSDQTDENGRVILTTIHGSKGLEWPVVFLPSLIENIIPSRFSLLEKNPEKRESLIDEERRCFYVALTRSKDILYLSTYKDDENSYQPSLPSSFINEIPSDCYKNISKTNESNIISLKNNSFKKLSSFNRLKVPNQYKFQSLRRMPKIPIGSQSKINTVNISEPPSSLLNQLPKQPQIVGGDGLTYNPVTGAAISTNGPPIKKRKRLGMGRPYKQLIPPKK